ncbi:unnamed protein product [Musa banksii]
MEGQGESGVSARGAKTYAFACAIIASIISILMGYDTGVMSGAMLFMKEDLNIQDEQVEVLAGIMNICALVGSLTAGRLSDWIGRRYTIVVASIIFFVGAVLMGLGLNYGMLFSGRCIAGVGVGYALMVAPVYSAEISSPSSRGFLTSLPEICISAGILLGYVSILPAAPPAEVRLAFDARRRRGAFGHAGRGDSGHAGVTAVAGHARPPQGRPGGAAAGVEHERGGGAEATGDKGGRGRRRELHRRRRRAGRHAPRGGRLEGVAAPAHPCGEAHPHRRPRHPFLRARYRDRSRGALHPEDLQEGGDQQQEQAPVRHHGHGGHQDGLHPGGHLPAGQGGQEAPVADERGRDDPVPLELGDRAHHGGSQPANAAMGARPLHCLPALVRGLLLRRPGARHLGLQLGYFP